jgi:hypothetical protein
MDTASTLLTLTPLLTSLLRQLARWLMCWLLVVAGVAVLDMVEQMPTVVAVGLVGFCTQPALPLRFKDIQL